MNVARILKDKGRNVATLAPETLMRDVVQTLAKERIGALVICDTDRHVVGIVSERDIVRVLAASGGAVLDQRVEQFMTKEVRTCTERDTVEWLMEEMTSHRFRHMPVVDGGRLIGIISIGDVVKHRLEEMEHESSALREYILTA